jgi:hypothetical protein
VYLVKSNIALVLFIITLIGTAVGALDWLNTEYAKRSKVNIADLHIRSDVLSETINQYSAWAAYYRRKAKEEGLTFGEQERFEHLEKQILRLYSRAEKIQDRQDNIEAQQ